MRFLFSWFLHLGAVGLVLLGVLDSSFLFIPVGNDLLLVILTATHHSKLLLYVLAASLGSAAGVLLLDLVARGRGEEGLKKMMSERRVNYIKQKLNERAAIAIIVACLVPPPFPFTAVIAAASAFQYPRARLVALVFGARFFRFLLIGLAAIWTGTRIVRLANSKPFEWMMAGFIVLCLVGSTISIMRWLKRGRA